MVKGLKVKHPKRHPKRKLKRGLNQTKRATKHGLRKGGKYARKIGKTAQTYGPMAGAAMGRPDIGEAIGEGGSATAEFGRRARQLGARPNKTKKKKKKNC